MWKCLANGAARRRTNMKRLTIVFSFNYCPNCGALMDKEDEHETG